MGRRMQTVTVQQSAQIDDAFTIQIKQRDGGASCRSQAYEPEAIRAPGKMRMPIIVTWMKERNNGFAHRIAAVRMVVLLVITALAGKRQVVGGGCTAQDFRKDMFAGMKLCGVGFRANAILAATNRTLLHQLFQFGGRALFSHAARV